MLEVEDWQEYQNMIDEIEKQRKQKLEWRAQYQPLMEVKGRKEKSEQRKIENDFIYAIHSEDDDSKLTIDNLQMKHYHC